MKGNARTRIGFWLERLRLPRPILFKVDQPYGRLIDGTRYINRVNGHVIFIPKEQEHA